MSTTDFASLLLDPSKVSDAQFNALKSIVEEYPYFQSARALHLKALKDRGSFKYNQELKTTAAYTTDRSVLFDFVTSEEFNQNKISERIKHNLEHLKNIELLDIDDISVNKSVIIDDALRQHINDTQPILDPDLFEERKPSKSDNIIAVDSDQIEESPEKQLQLGQPLEFDKTEVHSFTEWLKITNFKPIERVEQPETTTSKEEGSEINMKFELIDKFIKNNPKMPKVTTKGGSIDLSKDSVHTTDTLMTETLARIYLEQKNYDKAIQAYDILSLKYPEKSGFFADQIQAIKKLKEQNK